MPSKKTATKSVNILQIILVALLVIAAFAIGVMWTQLKMLKQGQGKVALNSPAPAGQAAPQGPQNLSDALWQEVIGTPVYTEGPADAKVTLVEFTDYQCPFCKRHFDQTEPQIESQYVKTGKIRWIIRDLPLSIHQNAHIAAEAARCAGDQNQYKQMHDKLFTTQTAWGELPNAQTTFASYATVLGMNANTFSQCLTSGKYKSAVDQDLSLADKIGANGTPTFYLNGQPLVGAQPFSQFKTAIDAALQ